MKSRFISFPLLLLPFLPFLLRQTPPATPSWDQALQWKKEGRFLEAAAAFEWFALPPFPAKHDPSKILQAIREHLDCLRRLNTLSKADEFLEKAADRHSTSPIVLAAIARAWRNLPHYGFLAEGRFHRGPRREGGMYVDATEWDRRRALQLLEQARQLSPGSLSPPETARILADYADALLEGRLSPLFSWSLQLKTDLSSLPEWSEEPNRPPSTSGAPVGPDGLPLYYAIPKSFEEAVNDGERVRFLLDQAARLDPSTAPRQILTWARFVHSQFGVETLADWMIRFHALSELDEERTNRFTLHTLSDDETIARLASGIRRFSLPEEHNPIRLLRRMVAETESASLRPQESEQAWNMLAEIYENRRQFTAAAECWRMSIERYGPGNSQWKQNRLNQIIGNWGTLEPLPSQPQDGRSSISFRFRNGRKVHFQAQSVNIRRLLDDVRQYLKSAPRELDWRRIQIEPLGYTLIEADRQRYLQPPVAEWTLDLEPLPNHFDRRIAVTAPPLAPGAWWLTAQMENGNTTHGVLWIQDTILVQKPLTNGILLFLADAETGTPIPNAFIEAFAYRTRWIEGAGGRSGRSQVETDTLPLRTDGNGLATLSRTSPDSLGPWQWLFTASDERGRFAFLGFSGFWSRGNEDRFFSESRGIVITDRPVYRPGQTIHFKAWFSPVHYDLPETHSPFAGRQIHILIHDPRGEKVLETLATADAWGGIQGEWISPSNATLGRYAIAFPDHPTTGYFHLEEYKKPEFEVRVETPDEPLMLGDSTKIRVVARYYFGADVQEGTVAYKIFRYSHTTRWYPPSPWDWLYGVGAAWISRYTDEPPPNTLRGRFVQSVRPWQPFARTPPELVAENRLPIGPNGALEIVLDTAPDRELFGNTDHRYEIIAEVTDASRRTIVGRGQCIAARKPFDVSVWPHRGFYRTGDPIEIQYTARRADGKAVAGTARIHLLRLVPSAAAVSLQPIEEWEQDATADGENRLIFSAAQPGQYRVRCAITDTRGHTVENTTEITIRGEAPAREEFHFTAFRLIPEQPIVLPATDARILIQSEIPDGSVLLFLRPQNGRYAQPEPLRLTGKTAVRTIPVTPGDRPNFFVEAVSVQRGRVWTDYCEFLVPPEERILNVALHAEQASVRPGQPNRLRLQTTGSNGRPVQAAFALTVYDRAVEYVSGGPNVPDIRTVFWKWKRHHWPDIRSSADRTEPPVVPPKTAAMASIGLFGGTVADDHSFLVPSPTPGATRRAPTAGLAADRMPTAAMAPSEKRASFREMNSLEEAANPDGDSLEGSVEASVRTEFADTALWAGSLETDENGEAEIVVPMPENLGEWKARVWLFGRGARVGEAETTFTTDKKFLLRLQAPRFFVEKDEVVLSANIHNRLPTLKAVQAILELEGNTLAPLDASVRRLTVGAGGEARVDWRVHALQEGEAIVRMKALTDEESDAMQMRFPVHVHGILRTESWSGVLRPPEEQGRLGITVPHERRPEQTKLVVRWSPTLAGALVDALPYLITYPHGCTEQTLNRFVPAVIVQRVLQQTGVNLAALKQTRANLNPQELGDPAHRAQGWKRFDHNPVFDEEELKEIIQTGLARLADMQNSDGGWNWFPGWRGESCPHLTAQIVHGLSRAREAGAPVDPPVLNRGVRWLVQYADRQALWLNNALEKKEPLKTKADNLDALVLAVLTETGQSHHALRDFLLRDRADLSLYGLALLGLALDREGLAGPRDEMIHQIAQYVEQDEENQTAWLRMNHADYPWWLWYGDEMESHAAFLKLLTRSQSAPLLASRLVKYLLNHRKHHSAWRSTRDTALCIEALADYLTASGEDKPDLTVEFRLDGQPWGDGPVRVTPDNLFLIPNTLRVEGSALSDGPHTLEILRTGRGPLYFNAYLTHFTLEDPIPEAGLEVRLRRRLFRIVSESRVSDVPDARGQTVSLTRPTEKREELRESDLVRIGDIVEIELTLESKNDYEYLMVEDPKAGGFEPVEVRSGYLPVPLWPYIEFRDDRINLFIRSVPRGLHSFRYRMRAEIPGRFGLLPARITGMYAPELSGLSGSRKVSIRD